MKSKDILYSKGSNDECYTPWYWVKPILEYIYYCWENQSVKVNWKAKTEDYIVWCPFDTENSEFVKQIRNRWWKVVYSHIKDWKDFYDYEPAYWDIIISNPPFTNKRKIFERALSFWKPFALLMTNTWLNDAAPKQLFKEKELQMMMFDKRIHFIKPDGTVDKKTTFSSSYYCWNFLPKQIIMKKLNN